MAAESPPGVAPHHARDADQTTLFSFEAVHDGRLITRLFGLGGEGSDVKIVAEVHPVHAPGDGEPQWRFYEFASVEEARRFADEALLALEYLGCAVTEKHRPGTAAGPGLGAGAFAA
jgi:hypothetical protein